MSGSIVVVCHTHSELDGKRGTIIGWTSGQQWRVNILGSQTVVNLTNHYLWSIADGWHEDMKSKLFNKEGIMQHFQGPGVPCPPRHTEFRDRRRVPTKAMIEAFWGEKVWKYMEDRLTARMHMAKPKLAGCFWGRELTTCHAIVFADGTPQSQASPYTSHEAGCWWPVLAVYYDASCTAIVAFCQAQALSLSRPYETHPTRVEWLPPPGAPPPQGPAPPLPPPSPPPPQPPAYVIHSSVTIEEVFSDTDSDKSWNMCEPPPRKQCSGKGKGNSSGNGKGNSSGSPHH